MDLEKQEYDVSDIESEFDDSEEEDPTFDIVEETRSSLSKLSIKKHTSKDMSARRNVSKAMEDCIEGGQDMDMIVPPELDEKDQKSYEAIHKLITAGHIEKLKVDQCKIYLRKHGLRLTGSKDTLIQRIKEHIDILDGRGEEKYPPSSFILNCKGDACTGDVVMFEQNVYEMFSIASRSATGPPCGTRVVAGRIVKESYGAKKQQHTFTVEVLWSKGEKPLPPLHPLLIKGRNLYRLKTLRQQWTDEAERQKIISEKHARGSVARSNREARVQEKEMRKMRKENRVSTDYKEKREAECKGRMPHPTLSTVQQQGTAHSKGKLLHSLSTASEEKKDQPQVQMAKGRQNEEKEHRNCTIVIQKNVISRENWPEERSHQRQPLTNMNMNGPSSYREERGSSKGIISNPSKSPLRMHNPNTHMPTWRGSRNGAYTNSTSPLRRNYFNAHIPVWRGSSNGGYANYNTISSPLRGHGPTTYNLSENMNYSSPQRTLHHQERNGWCNAGAAKRSFPGPREDKKKPCRFYLQGRCYYGHDCRYSHGSEGDWVPYVG